MTETLDISPSILITAFAFNEPFKKTGFASVVGQIPMQNAAWSMLFKVPNQSLRRELESEFRWHIETHDSS